VLVVDDAPQNVEIVRIRLESQSYDVITAADGIEAIAQVKAHLPDLVLLDVMMPRLDGLATVRQLKADASLPFIPVIMLTALSDRSEVVAGLDAGADEYLTKPFDAGALLARVRAMLRTKALHDQVRMQAAQLAEWNQTLEQRVAEQLAQLQRTGTLKRFLPPQIAELVLSSGEEILRSHRREIAVLFCDLRAFTAFSADAEPEEQIAMLADYHAGIGALINAFQGTLVHIIGDGVMVVFNDPILCADPCLRAVRLAVALRDCVAALMTKWHMRGYDLGFGIGIAQGFATLGLIGSDERAQYTAIGSVTNLASRLCGEAVDGQILIDSKVNAALDGLVDVADAGDYMLKGFRRPTRVFNVLRLRDTGENPSLDHLVGERQQ
jgi:class 3 adenylate cyclase